MKTAKPRQTVVRRGATKARRGSKPGPLVAPIVYLESSALIALLLERDHTVMDAVPRGARLVTSALTFAEASRAIVRARMSNRLVSEHEPALLDALRRFRRRTFVLEVDDRVLARAGRRFPVEPIRTLDAIHLASAERLDDSPPLVTVVTRDVPVRENATAMGFSVA